MNEIVDIKYVTHVRIRDLQNIIDQLVEKKSLSEMPEVLPQMTAKVIVKEQGDLPKPCLTRKRLPLTSELLKILSEKTTNINIYNENLGEFLK